MTAMLLAHAYRSNRSQVNDKDDGLFELPCDLPGMTVKHGKLLHLLLTKLPLQTT